MVLNYTHLRSRLTAIKMALNKRAQGLPINFIVLAAIAILILILVVGFVIGGGTSFTKSVTPTMLRQNCESACSNLQTLAATKTWGTNTAVWTALGKTMAQNPFCIKQEYQGGPAGGSNCIDIGVNCYVTFADGIQKQVTCV